MAGDSGESTTAMGRHDDDAPERGPARRSSTPRLTIAQNFEIYGASSEDDLHFLRSLGFTQVILDFPQLAEPAESLGFAVVLANWWDKTTPWSHVEAMLQFADGLDNVVSVNMMDEPIYNGTALHGPEVYLSLRRAIRQAGFDEWLSLTMYGPQLSWPASWSRLFIDYLPAIDILRIDPYPLAAGKPLRQVAQWIDQARLLMRAAGRDLPLTVVLEAWDSGAGLPSIGEIRVMAYMALLSGVETVSFYNYSPPAWNSTPGFTQGFAELMSELLALAQEFDGAEIHPILGPDAQFQAEIHLDGQWTCITVNTLRRPNGRLGPLQVVRQEGRCPRPFRASGPQQGLLPPNRKRIVAPFSPSGDSA
jgi:hypothetical protein